MAGIRTSLFQRYIPGGIRTLEDIFDVPGQLFIVDGSRAGAANASGYGRSPEQPLLTIDYAIGLCDAGKGDKILVMPGHVESLGSGETIDLDVAGVTIQGLGSGALVPQVHFDHATAGIDVGANGCTIRNLRLLPSVATVAIGIDIEAGVTDTLIEDVEILPGEDGSGADEFVLGVDVKAGCSRTVIRRLKARQHASADGVNAGISLTGATDDVVVEDCDIVALGSAAVAPIKGITTASTNVRIQRCRLVTDAEPGIELLTGTSGVLSDNDIFSNLATVAAAIVADGCALFRNQYVETGGESGAAIGAASADD